MKNRVLCLDRWVGVLVLLLLSVKVNSRSVFDVLGDNSGSDESVGKEVSSWESQESNEGILGNSSYNQVPVNPVPSLNLDNVPVPYLKAPPPDTTSFDAYGVGLDTGTSSGQESLSVESPESPGTGSSEEWPHLAVYQVTQGQSEATNGSDSALPQALDGASQGQSTPADKPLRFSPRLSLPFSRSQPANYRSDLPFDRDDYRNYVVNSQPLPNGSNQTAQQRVEYEFFCQEPGLHQLHVLHHTHKPGYIIAIYSEDRKFGTLDKVKCVSGEDADDDGDSDDDIFEADEADEDDIYFELDANQSEIISLNPEDAAHQAFCPSGYLLTGLSRSIQQNSTLLTTDAQQPPPPTSYDVPPPPLDTYATPTEPTTLILPGPPTEGHCSKLIRGVVDYTICESVATLAKPGGSLEPYVEWNVECPFGHAAVGLKVHEKRVKSLRCCKLTRAYI